MDDDKERRHHSNPTSQTLRPDFDRLVENKHGLECFASFCEKNFVAECLACFMDIKTYKDFFLESTDANVTNNHQPKSPVKTLLQLGKAIRTRLKSALGKNEADRPFDDGMSSCTTNTQMNERGWSCFEDNVSVTSFATTSELTLDGVDELVCRVREISQQSLENAYNMALLIISQYLSPNSPTALTVDLESKREILSNTNLLSLEGFLSWPSISDKIVLFEKIELEILLLLNNEIIPKFSRSDDWLNFVKEDYESALRCCYLEDIAQLDRIKFTKQDFMRDAITMKDLEVAEMFSQGKALVFHYVIMQFTSSLFEHASINSLVKTFHTSIFWHNKNVSVYSLVRAQTMWTKRAYQLASFTSPKLLATCRVLQNLPYQL